MPVRLGVIGAGGIARRRTIPEGIVPSEKVVLAAVMDPVGISDIAAQFGVKRCYSREEDLIADRDVEGVYIATPAHLHHRQVLAGIEAGKHVLCEKPLGLTMEECLSARAAAERAGVVLMVGFMMRFHSCHRKAKELIESGALGQPVLGRAQLTCWYPPIQGAWRQDPKLGGGGALMDMGIHCIDLLRYFFGEVREVMAFTDNITHGYPVDDSATVILKFQNGAQGIVDSNFNIPDEAAQNCLELYGTRGAISARGTIGQSSVGRLTLYSQTQGGYDAQQKREGGKAVEIVPEPVNIYRAEIEHFADCITGALPRSAAAANLADGIRAEELVLAAYESSRTRRAVR